MIKIVLTGPESSGKSTLAKALATYFKVPLVLEYARIYLEENGPSYAFEDLDVMLQGQLDLENLASGKDSELIICDTDILTYKIWSAFKYGKTSAFIKKHFAKIDQAHYILCAPDFNWEADALREHPENRWEIYSLYKDELAFYNCDYLSVEGSRNIRESDSIEFIEQII